MNTQLMRVVAAILVIAFSSLATAETPDFKKLQESILALSVDDRKQALEKLEEVVAEIEAGLPAEPKPPDPWYKKLQIRQSAYDKNSISKPGTLQYTNPDDGDSSYAVNVGITYPAIDSTSVLLGPKIEYHRNTLIDKEQDTLRVGVVGSILLGSVVDVGNDDEVAGWAWWSDNKLDYKSDRIKDTESLVLSSMFTPLNGNRGFGAAVSPLGDNLPMRFDAAVGLEYEDIFDSGSDKDGNTIRATAYAGIILFPFSEALASRVQLGASAQYWNELSQSGDFDDGVDSFDNVQVYLNYYFDDDWQYGVGITHVNGDSPVDGLLDQSYTKFGFLVKIGD